MGRYRWIEERLFEVMGSWVAGVPEPAVQRYLATQCQRHAWHASLWHDRLPAILGVSDDAAPPAGDPLLGFAEALASSGRPDESIEKLAGVSRVVLPRLAVTYGAYLEGVDALTDGPTHRVLTLILRDERDAWQEGEALLQSLIHTPADAARAAGHQARLEGLLVSGTGFAGPS